MSIDISIYEMAHTLYTFASIISLPEIIEVHQISILTKKFEPLPNLLAMTKYKNYMG
ncbi:MAG: hypothetical protein SWO11_10455 [Thermodesulfobacteriota bacterium]|nr:hypothetical protein [Thermodesulfobacteriota bacterium]